MKRKLKLYVWEEIFCDYTDGIAFALAESPDHARKLILENREGYLSTEDRSRLATEPKEVTEPTAFVQFGGG